MGVEGNLEKLRHVMRKVCGTVFAMHTLRKAHCDLSSEQFVAFENGDDLRIVDVDTLAPLGKSYCDVLYDAITDEDADEPFCKGINLAPELAGLYLALEAGKRTLPGALSGKSDVFSLGLMCAEWITGERLLEDELDKLWDDDGDDDTYYEWLASEKGRKRIEMKVRKLEKVLSKIDPQLADFTTGMLAYDEAKRSAMVDVFSHPFLQGSNGLRPSLPKGGWAAAKVIKRTISDREPKRRRVA